MIDKELFWELRQKALESEKIENSLEDVELLEKAVFKRLKKKRSIKKYKKLGVSKGDLNEIIELADVLSLDAIGGPSNMEIADNHPEWCNNCGRCCKESSPIFIHKDEVNILLTFNSDLKDEIIPNVLYPEHYQFKEDKPCKFHNSDVNKCKIYDSRPQVCGNYPLMLVERNGKGHNIVNLRYNCNYAVLLVLEKSMILFDEAIKRLKDK
ncbi:YkgJ family cysteine cluster protein [Methanobacterium petrolearium]|uniref:YkgJ family cysteine cluster protein n=1 Tax=Methanobacterium petrolearium TaxID=710190 RepID=UPI001FD7B6C1|nr:YkgJ family cysteine cluster protein [Methanobacterium petrolearium]